MLPKYDENVRSTTCEKERGERIDLTVVDKTDVSMTHSAEKKVNY